MVDASSEGLRGRAFVARLADALSAPRIYGGGGLDRARGRASSSGTDAGPVGRTAVTVPDLNGDGLDDVLVFESLRDFSRTTLRAIRGYDGKELWRIGLSGFVLFEFLRVVGGPRLLLVAIEPVASPLDDAAGQPTTWDQTVSIVDGPTGATVASRTIRGSYLPVVAVDALGLVMQGGDADGDGTLDLMVETLSATGLGVGVGPSPFVDASAFHVHAEYWNTNTLATISSADAVGQFGTEILPLGDVNADGHPDILIHDGPSHARVLRAASLDGLVPYWVALGETNAVVFLDDVTGDGFDDVFVNPIFPDSTAGPRRILDGRTGKTLWSGSFNVPSFCFLIPVGSIDSGKGSDAIDDCLDHFGDFYLRGFDGATGKLLWGPTVTSLPFPPDATGGGGILGLCCPFDITGDGVREAFAYAIWQKNDGSVIEVEGLSVSGRDGSVLWDVDDRTPSDDFAVPSPILPPLGRQTGADVDGNGSDDVLTVTHTDVAGVAHFDITTMDGAALAPLWTAIFDAPEATGPFVPIAYGGRLISNGRAQLVATVAFEDGVTDGRIIAYDSTGPIWEIL